MEPNTTFTLGFSPTIADGVTLIGGHGWTGTPSVSFVKGFNGTLATVGNGVEMEGIDWDGNKANYSGDGLELVGGCNSCHFRGVRVHRNAGSGLVADGHYFNVFDGCRFDQNDGWGAEFIEATDHISQNSYRGWTQFAENGMGGVHYDATTGPTHSEHYRAVISSNGGPGFYVEADNTRAWDVKANVTQNDGPTVVMQNDSEGNRMEDQGSSWHLHASGNTANMANDSVTINGGTRDLGIFHVQGDAGLAENVQLAGAEISGRYQANKA